MAGPEHCQFFVERKKRFCRMSVKKGKSYCGEHQSTRLDVNHTIVDERINCPLDPTHTCYQSKLSKHLKVCNANVSQDSEPSYVVRGINLGDGSSQSINDVPLSEIKQNVVDNVLNKIEEAYAKLPSIPEEILNHPVLEKELKNATYGNDTKRHLIQTASLLGHLASADLVKENTCFIEFGAGRGKLTYWLGQTIRNQACNSSILLIDRSSHRHKKDNKLRNEDVDVEVTRVRTDIADLKLSAIPAFQKMRNKVAIAKHICGVATDLTLRCITNSIEKAKSSNDKWGLLIAFCCHHRCEYSHYVGNEYLKSANFERDDFPILCKIASWATCGIKRNDAKVESEREIVGRKAKALLNWGRLEYLKTHGFRCRLVHYTSIETTLENVCVIGTL